jgi:heme-degrading monooxygenase HmoA
MIARHWHGVTRSDAADAYARYLDNTGIRDYRATAGNRGVLALRRVEDGHAHFDLFSFWDSLEAVKAFAGENIDEARYYPEDRQYLIDLEPTVVHYEVLSGI